MAYVYKATITLSRQKYVYITKHKILPIEGMKKKIWFPTIILLWYLNGMLVIVDKLHLK